MKYSFSGVGAKHQNGIAELNIKNHCTMGTRQHASSGKQLAEYADSK
jgi:hypothetical protein